MQSFSYDDPSRTFLGVRFVLFGFDSPKADKVRSKLLQEGGLDAVNYGPDCSHVIVENLAFDDPICLAARKDGKVLVTAIWVDHSCDAGMPVDPTSVMYRPVIDLNGIQGARSLVICLTGYIRNDRDDIMTMVSLMGAAFSKPLVANRVTHLICYKFEGEKYELAKRMKKIKLVNHRWLEDSLKAWKLLPEADYSKSGYELEVAIEAKDSQEETECPPANADLGRGNISSHQITHIGNTAFYQSPLKHEVSRNSSSLNPSETVPYAAGSQKTQSNSGKEMALLKTLCAMEAPDKNHGTLHLNNLQKPRELYPDVPSLNQETVISEQDGAFLSSMPKSAQKSPIDVPESSGMRIFRGSPTAPPSLKKMESNSGGLSPLNLNEHRVGDLRMALEGLPNGAGPDMVITPLKGTLLHGKDELTVTMSNKRKMTTPSHSDSKSSKFSSTQVESIQRGVGRKILNVLASGSGSSVKSSGVLGYSSPVAIADGCSREVASGEVPHKNLEMLSSDNSKIPGELSHDVPSLNHETVVSEKDEAFLSSMPRIFHKSPIDVPKSSGRHILVGSPIAPISLEKMESNSVSPLKQNEHGAGGIHMASEGRHHGTSPDTVKMPLNGTNLHGNNESAVTMSNKRKITSSDSGSKSSKYNRTQVASMDRGVAKEVLKVPTPGSTDGSSGNGCSGEESSRPTKASGIAISPVNEQELNGDRLTKKTLSKFDLMDFSSGQTSNYSGDVEMHENEADGIEPVPHGASCGPQKIDTENFSTCEKSAANSKPFNRKMFARKSLGARPATGKRRTIIHKGSTNPDKAELLNESNSHCNEEYTKKNSGDSSVLENVVPVSVSTDEDAANGCLFGSEIEADMPAEASVPCIGHGVHPRKKLDDSEALRMEELPVKSTGITEGNAADTANQSKENEANLAGDATRKRFTKAKKRPLVKSKTNALPNPSDEPKIDADCKKVKEKVAPSDIDEALMLTHQPSSSASKKPKSTRKKEKENQPNKGFPKGFNVDSVAEAGNVTSELPKKSHQDSLKSSKPDQNSKKGVNIHQEKAGRAYFILSGHRLQRKEFRNVVMKLKGRICRDSHHWSYQATHFIVPDPVRRTEKFFAAAASGSWILKTDYLTACNEAGKFLPEEPYEWHAKSLTEDGAINLEAPRKWRLLKATTSHGAFYGMKILIYGECIAPPLETLKRVVKAGGGTIVATSPPYTRLLQSKIDLAVVSPGMPRVDMWIQEFLRHEVPCVVADYLVEFVCKPGYSLDKHVQYNTQSWAKRSLDDHVNRMEELEDVRTPPATGDDDDVACKACGRRDAGDEMLICGDESGRRGCGVGMHIFCLEPPLEWVPRDDWFCPTCLCRPA